MNLPAAIPIKEIADAGGYLSHTHSIANNDKILPPDPKSGHGRI